MASATAGCGAACEKDAPEVTEICDSDFTPATQTFWKPMENAHHVSLGFENESPTSESLRSISEVDDILAAGGTEKSFDSARALLDAARA